jgi:predicted hydrolase (HD superfamily)
MVPDGRDGGTMSYGLNREEALALLKDHLQNQNMIKHCLASEAVMIALAEKLGPCHKASQ